MVVVGLEVVAVGTDLFVAGFDVVDDRPAVVVNGPEVVVV